jgi:hypothetical protein
VRTSSPSAYWPTASTGGPFCCSVRSWSTRYSARRVASAPPEPALSGGPVPGSSQCPTVWRCSAAPAESSTDAPCRPTHAGSGGRPCDWHSLRRWLSRGAPGSGLGASPRRAWSWPPDPTSGQLPGMSCRPSGAKCSGTAHGAGHCGCDNRRGSPHPVGRGGGDRQHAQVCPCVYCPLVYP